MRRNITDDSASRSDFAIALVIEGRTEGEPMRRNVTGIDRQDVEALNALGAGGGPATPTIRLTLQGKGGGGESLVSSILAQYFRPRGVLASRISSRTSERCEAFSRRSPPRRSFVYASQSPCCRACTMLSTRFSRRFAAPRPAPAGLTSPFLPAKVSPHQ